MPNRPTRLTALALTLCLSALACAVPPVEQPAPDAFLVATLRFES